MRPSNDPSPSREPTVRRPNERRSGAARSAPELSYDASPFVPRTSSTKTLRAAAKDCRGCPLYRNATQTVFGAGAVRASIVIVGEQPGDMEDRAGKPFIGPAGKLLDRALEEAGISRDEAYVTNAVKHFKFEPRGKIRLHQKPTVAELKACNPWLRAELDAIRPDVVVCLGATAARSVLERNVRIGVERGKKLPGPSGLGVIVTSHPSAILRMPEKAAREEAFHKLVSDLTVAMRSR